MAKPSEWVRGELAKPLGGQNRAIYGGVSIYGVLHVRQAAVSRRAVCGVDNLGPDNGGDPCRRCLAVLNAEQRADARRDGAAGAGDA